MIDSFIIYICTESMVIVDCFDHSEELRAGEAILIPAAAGSVTLIPGGAARLLEVYIPQIDT
jgi:mannose-6-phosphate isomerase class I